MPHVPKRLKSWQSQPQKAAKPVQAQRVQLRTRGESRYKGEHPELYRRYHEIMYRCCNPSHKDYSNYGGRGIEVCTEWMLDFTRFVDYVTALPGYSLDLTIDRIDNNGDYRPGNIRWATRKEQNNNKSR